MTNYKGRSCRPSDCTLVNGYSHWKEIVIVKSKFIKCHEKGERRTPAYSRELRPVREVLKGVVKGDLGSDSRSSERGRAASMAGVVQLEKN